MTSKILQDFESLFSATAVEQLIKEDAIIIGRLNCDEFAMGSTEMKIQYNSVKNLLIIKRLLEVRREGQRRQLRQDYVFCPGSWK